MAILVTGGAGFIGSDFVLEWLTTSDEQIVNFDELTYAGNRDNLASAEKDIRLVLERGVPGAYYVGAATSA